MSNASAVRSPGGRGRGGHSLERKGPTHRRVYRRSVAVFDNVVAFTVPRRAIDTAAARQLWRGAGGAVVNTVPWPALKAG